MEPKRFERLVQPFAEWVPPRELRVGEVYFQVSFHDPDLRIPDLRALVFIGRDLEPGDGGILYFQDYDSHAEGDRLDDGETEREIHTFEESGCSVCTYDGALDQLLWCSLHRGR